MSGNPFRLSLHQKQPVVHHEATLSFPDAPTGRADASGQQKDTVIPASTPAKTTKKVRIESPSSFPPHPGFPTPSDSIAHRSSISNNIGPLPPASPTSSSDSLEDYEEYPLNADVGKHGEEDQTLMRNTKGMASAGGGTSGPIAGGIPANPFQKTLATIEPSVKSPLHREGPLERRTPDKTGAGNARASMDVDAFTRLLMTGNASPSASGASAVPQNPNVAGIKVESSSSTDTSSISRQSIFEPIQEAHSETPRTSYEMAASDDEDQTSLVGEPVKAEKKKPKPPPPKHRHGKLVASRTPQTVSFSDFSPSFVEPTTPPSSSSRSAISPSSIRSRNNSDLNKPLPPPPEPSYFPQETQHTSPAVSITPEPQIHPQSPSPEPASSSSIPQKRVPPASESSLRYEYVGGPAEKPAEVGKEGGAGTEEEIQTTGDSAAILDDMERLQREVDALRERYGGV
ncbi:hypothetical protein BU16DRAFT_248303 [Lophium mytilinum]|uniref:Uncharacterized protein n=1 Tax=Lophium mytilinum TaxID=390894 RepID=A0A6A6R7D5_9PEZI|nr:hypothetical protein BU16DRAFT_248303 [Lophium mytilinum]